MSRGRWLTLETLASRQNLAAQRLILELIFHAPKDLAERAFSFILQRKDRDALTQLVFRMDQLTDNQQDRLAGLGGELATPIRNAYVATEEPAFRHACRLIERTRAYEQISLILGSLEHDSPRKDDARRLIDYLTKELGKELDRDSTTHTVADARTVRRQYLSSMEVAYRRFVHHKVNAVPEAFLRLAEENSELVKRCLTEQSLSCHGPMIDAIHREQDESIVRWIFIALQWRTPPTAVLRTLCRRKDIWFVRLVLDRVGMLANGSVHQTVRGFREVAWLNEQALPLESLTPAQQRAAVVWASNTSIPLGQKLGVFARILDRGEPPARLAAACALATVPGSDANRLLEECLDDVDLDVQWAATRQVRLRGLSNAQAILLEKLRSPDPRIQSAARAGLVDDYDFDKFMRRFDQMDETNRKATGELVARIDPDTDDKLRQHLESGHRSFRLRSLEIIECLSAADRFIDNLIDRLDDADHIVRRKAFELLRTTAPEPTRARLMSRLEGASAKRRAAAQSALSALEETFATTRTDPQDQPALTNAHS